MTRSDKSKGIFGYIFMLLFPLLLLWRRMVGIPPPTSWCSFSSRQIFQFKISEKCCFIEYIRFRFHHVFYAARISIVSVIVAQLSPSHSNGIPCYFCYYLRYFFERCILLP